MIGFACKVVPDTIFSSPDQYHTKSTTVTALRKLSTADAHAKLAGIVSHNLMAIKKLVQTVGELPPALRMLRLPSDILPLYTHEITSTFWKHAISEIEEGLSIVGDIARDNGVRLSMHPAQMILISSANEATNTRSIAELDYHAMLAEMMGYAKQFQDFKCNIHVNGAGVDAFRANWKKLPERVKRIITVENDEYTSGLSECIKLSDLCPIVFDIHHDWIHTGSFRLAQDPLIQRVVDSWRGIRPVMHASTSRYALASEKPLHECTGPEKRSHSSYMWDAQLNDRLVDYAVNFDIMVEAKRKNKSARLLYDHISRFITL